MDSLPDECLPKVSFKVGFIETFYEWHNNSHPNKCIEESYKCLTTMTLTLNSQ